MGRNQSGMLVLGGIVATLLLLILLLGGNGDRRIDASPIGTHGLEIWLNENDIATARSHRRTTLTQQDVALRILPLYDVDPTRDASAPTSRDARRRQESQRDIDANILREKIAYVPSLVMLPKWRAGVLELDLLDEQLLIDDWRFGGLLRLMGAGRLQIQRPDMKFLQTSRGITLYRPQLFAPDTVTGDCRPHLSTPEGVLIVRCDQNGNVPLYILSDPDFLNNHGLSLGRNAVVATDVVNGLVGSHPGPVYLDTSPEILLATDPTVERETRPRTVEEVSRLLTYPFSLIWIGVGICFLVMLWRGLIRFGPPRPTDQGHIAASKSASIAAKGYLMRLTGDDRSLLHAFVAEKMQALGRDILGKQVQTDAPKLMRRLRTIAPQHAPQLQVVLDDIDHSNPDTAPAELARLADRFEQIYQRIRDELGYVSRRR